jgi:DNA-binding IclR family transcriptional regulator
MVRDCSVGALDINAQYLVKPVIGAFRVLRAISTSTEPQTLADLAAVTGLGKTTVLRYLRTLELLDYVTTGDRRRYGIGPAIWAINTEDNRERTLKHLSAEVLSDLHKTYDETVNLGVPKGRRIYYLVVLESSKPLSMRAGQGDADCFHCTALGKAILAHVSLANVGTYLNEPLPQLTDHTITEKRVLLRELNSIRHRGFAVDREENEVGSVCFGAPIHRADGTPAAAISLYLPKASLTDQLDLEISESIREGARRISGRLNSSEDPARFANVAPSNRGRRKAAS